MKKTLFLICLSTVVLAACTPKNQILKIIPQTIESPLEGGEYLVHIQSSSDASDWTASVDKDWVKLSATSGEASEAN
ncbi:MAG: BACON domain-containing protein [Paludibacteraceae bacterium]|nr:BACON domain-containing protein [Paludibacteraceae bacterium]